MNDKKLLRDKIINAFLEVSGTVWGIEMRYKSWNSEDMSRFNRKIAKIRDKLLAELTKHD